MSTTRLLDHFSALDDPRQSWKVTYPLPEVLLIVLCATMAGAEDFVQIELWANRKLDFLHRFLPFEKGIPSHDTLKTSSTPCRPIASRLASRHGSTSCATLLPISSPSTVRPPGAVMAGPRAATLLHLVSAWASRRHPGTDRRRGAPACASCTASLLKYLTWAATSLTVLLCGGASLAITACLRSCEYLMDHSSPPSHRF